MKQILLFLGLFSCFHTFGQILTTTVTTNGIAPIPSFTLEKPAAFVVINTNITKHLEFSPDFAFNLKDGNPWIMDTWLKWNQNLDSNWKWVATVAVNWSIFFQPYLDGGEKITQSVRYPNPELKLKFTPNKMHSFTVDYQYMWAVEKKYGVKGSYYGFLYSLSKELHKFVLSGNANNFYLHFSDGTHGWSGSLDANLMHAKSGLFAGFQFVQPYNLNNAKFQKGFFIGISRKLH